MYNNLYLRHALIILLIAASPLATVYAIDSEPLYADHPLSYWIDRLAMGDRSERRMAAHAMISLAPPREDVIGLLIDALKQRTDYELAALAANALRQIGPAAKSAVPALVEGLNAPDWTENSLRELAAAALAAIQKDTPTSLIETLETTTDETRCSTGSYERLATYAPVVPVQCRL